MRNIGRPIAAAAAVVAVTVLTGCGGTTPPAPSPTASAPTPATATSGAWTYREEPAEGGTRRVAEVPGAADSGSARLIFVDDPVTGRRAYVEFTGATVPCLTGCRVQVTVDGRPALTPLASRPESPQQRLSMRDERSVWAAVRSARGVSITYPTESGDDTARFDVTGANPAWMPWR